MTGKREGEVPTLDAKAASVAIGLVYAELKRAKDKLAECGEATARRRIVRRLEELRACMRGLEAVAHAHRAARRQAEWGRMDAECSGEGQT